MKYVIYWIGLIGILVYCFFLGVSLGTFGSIQLDFLNQTTLAIFGILEILLLTSMCLLWYIQPVEALQKEIARFITGSKVTQISNLKTKNRELEYIIRFFQRSLEILHRFKEEYHAGKVLKSEVDFASEIQKHVLGKKPINPPSLDIIANSKSATEVGGDSYDIIINNENTYIYIGDVTGHGVASGFIMMIVNALISALSKIFTSGAQILAKTNEIVKPRVKSNMLMTLLLIRWDEFKKELWMTGAGHENLLVYKKSKQKTYAVKSGGIALAMTKNIEKIVKDVQIPFETGDIVVMYTDGITEARSNGKLDSLLYGVERLIEVIDSAEEKTAEGIYRAISSSLSNYMGYTHKQFDDITLIVIHYRGDEIIQYTGTEIPDQNLAEWKWSENAKTALGKKN